MLVSFQLASNRPGNFVGLLDNLETRATRPDEVEVAVKVDLGDDEMIRIVQAEVQRRRIRIKPLISEKGDGFADLWKAYNQLFAISDNSAYFHSILNDEVRIDQNGWDEILRKYVGLFPDSIFRLRVTPLKLRNYYDFWECGFAPDSYAFYSRKWLASAGDWGIASTPDSCQQFVAYYLGKAGIHSFGQINRDVPIFDLSFSSGQASQGLTPEQQARRNTTNFRMWFDMVSHRSQEELCRRGRLLEAHVRLGSDSNVSIETDRRSKAIVARDLRTGEIVHVGSYRIGRLSLALANLRRMLHFHYYGGGGDVAWNFWPFSLLDFLAIYFPLFRKLMRPVLVSGKYWIAREVSAGLALALKHRQPELFRMHLRSLEKKHPGWRRVHRITGFAVGLISRCYK